MSVTVSRVAMWALLAAVSVAAAVLSFTALRDLGRMSTFESRSWLLPVVIDAGAAAASLVWLGRWAPERARSFARVLALTLLGLSVAGNALSHGMTAEGVQPHWLVVVAVSAIAPAVLGAVVHLAVLATDRDAGRTVAGSGQADAPRADSAVPSASVVAVQVPDSVRVQVADSMNEDVPAVSGQGDPARHRKLSAIDPDRSAKFHAWVAEIGERPTEYAVRKQFNCRQSVAQRLLAELDEDVDDRAAV